mgnify:CR=1 FL=1
MVYCFWFKFFSTKLGLDITRKCFLVFTPWWYSSHSCSIIAIMLICRRWFRRKVWTFFYHSHFRGCNFGYYFICNMGSNAVIPRWIYSSLPDYDFRTMFMWKFKKWWLKTKMRWLEKEFPPSCFYFLYLILLIKKYIMEKKWTTTRV